MKKIAEELLKIAKELVANKEDEYKKIVAPAMKEISSFAYKNVSDSGSKEISEHLRRIGLVFEKDKVYNKKPIKATGQYYDSRHFYIENEDGQVGFSDDVLKEAVKDLKNAAEEFAKEAGEQIGLKFKARPIGDTSFEVDLSNWNDEAFDFWFDKIMEKYDIKVHD